MHSFYHIKVGTVDSKPIKKRFAIFMILVVDSIINVYQEIAFLDNLRIYEILTAANLLQSGG